ncbi:hypothetical protein BaRGS_00029023 [Batillaria attramentaria]|uniref:Uncharacterized protein n=1 Tax=Batillaria attramentaria TaxID=370345 RepID=A0ABD0JYH1_9CAEN
MCRNFLPNFQPPEDYTRGALGPDYLFQQSTGVLLGESPYLAEDIDTACDGDNTDDVEEADSLPTDVRSRSHRAADYTSSRTK